MAEKISVLLPEEQVAERIRNLGEKISRDYAGKEIRLVCILKGGVFFMTELAKHISVPVTIDFMSMSSYGNATVSSGRVRILKDLDEPVENMDVIIVEDIIDSGKTLSYLLKLFESRRVASIKLCTLLDKPDRREVDVDVDYVGFSIPDHFVVGCGLDYEQRYRNLPYVGIVSLDKEDIE